MFSFPTKIADRRPSSNAAMNFFQDRHDTLCRRHAPAIQQVKPEQIPAETGDRIGWWIGPVAVPLPAIYLVAPEPMYDLRGTGFPAILEPHLSVHCSDQKIAVFVGECHVARCATLPDQAQFRSQPRKVADRQRVLQFLQHFRCQRVDNRAHHALPGRPPLRNAARRCAGVAVSSVGVGRGLHRGSSGTSLFGCIVALVLNDEGFCLGQRGGDIPTCPDTFFLADKRTPVWGGTRDTP